ncbi:MAG: hypothetical protein CVU39_04540 [Chloroflexi bacterium HGW-Chloroflexi-10]|nr:MAG: hypothetical protein CVU39_04540 [Chloroflexi bacterium HGW-Chloroflexi-10]
MAAKTPGSRKISRPNEKNDKHYLLIVIGFLVLVGSGVIWLVFGPNALILALPVLLGGALLLLLPFYLIQFLGWLVAKFNKD